MLDIAKTTGEGCLCHITTLHKELVAVFKSDFAYELIAGNSCETLYLTINSGMTHIKCILNERHIQIFISQIFFYNRSKPVQELLVKFA